MSKKPLNRGYLAAPLFSKAEQHFNERLAKQLIEMFGIELHLPQDFCKEASDLDDVFSLCVKKLKKAGYVVAIVDGSDADSGTSWEIGYAYANKIPIICVRTDFRLCESAESHVNAMIAKSAMAMIVMKPDCTYSELAMAINAHIVGLQGADF